jgi:hypothetical protein
MANLGWIHWDAIKRVFRYLQVTFKYALCFHGYPTRHGHSMSIMDIWIQIGHVALTTKDPLVAMYSRCLVVLSVG